MVDRIKIIQAPTITSGFIKDMARGHDGVHIHLNMSQSVGGCNDISMNDTELLSYIETFPQPRLKNFIRHIYYVASQKYGNKVNTATELGCNLRTMYRQEQLKKGMDYENPD